MINLNLCYPFNQIQASLASPTADPNGLWHECTKNHARCAAWQMNFLQGDLTSFVSVFMLCVPNDD